MVKRYKLYNIYNIVKSQHKFDNLSYTVFIRVLNNYTILTVLLKQMHCYLVNLKNTNRN